MYIRDVNSIHNKIITHLESLGCRKKNCRAALINACAADLCDSVNELNKVFTHIIPDFYYIDGHNKTIICGEVDNTSPSIRKWKHYAGIYDQFDGCGEWSIELCIVERNAIARMVDMYELYSALYSNLDLKSFPYKEDFSCDIYNPKFLEALRKSYAGDLRYFPLSLEEDNFINYLSSDKARKYNHAK